MRNSVRKSLIAAGFISISDGSRKFANAKTGDSGPPSGRESAASSDQPVASPFCGNAHGLTGIAARKHAQVCLHAILPNDGVFHQTVRRTAEDEAAPISLPAPRT